MSGRSTSTSHDRSIHPALVAGIFIIVPILFILAAANGGRSAATVKSASGSPAYIAEVDGWHQKRITNLKREHGWLSLVALDWLKDGINPIDSIGTARVSGGAVVVTMRPGVHALLKGAAFVSGTVKTDADTSGADKIVVGSRAFIIIKRGEKIGLRMWDAAAPARAAFTDIERYPVSAQWKIDARWEPYAEPKHVSIETVVPGISEDGVVTGAAVFTVGGVEQRLEPIVTDSVSAYFFIVGDATNGRETYGGGRFLDADPPKNGRITLDFNKMINPPCAFSSFATCPRPLPGNRLAIRIEAGEKNYGHH